MVEIMKSLVQEVQLLIMDEPTAALNSKERDRLFEQIRNLKARGISVIYISHRMEEILSSLIGFSFSGMGKWCCPEIFRMSRKSNL